MKPKIVVVLGPTAVGKSAAALELAEELNLEIINADSQQVYRYMDIGTGKPTPEQRERVPHHLIDLVNPDADFNAGLYSVLATETVYRLQAAGKRALVCGGSGLYIKALLHGLFFGAPKSPEIRETLTREIDEKGLQPLYQRLLQVDPCAFSRIHPNDRQRIIRALEVYQLSGKPISDWQKTHAFGESRFETLKIGLDRERGELYDLINGRCERMVKDGLVDEVRALVARGYDLQLSALQSVGYRHAGLFLTGSLSLEEAVSLMKRDTRRLAKRQLTWFRGDREIEWYYPDNDKEDLRERVVEFYREA